MTDDAALSEAARRVLALCRGHGLRIATAESCTGGLIAAYLTEIPGSSDVFERGFVTYSNEAKAEMLGVDAAVIAREGAVSEGVARAMAAGALARSGADMAIAVTGVAGPGGGTAQKPVGLVHLAAASRRAALHRVMMVGERGRGDIRRMAVGEAFGMLTALAAQDGGAAVEP